MLRNLNPFRRTNVSRYKYERDVEVEQRLIIAIVINFPVSKKYLKLESSGTSETVSVKLAATNNAFSQSNFSNSNKKRFFPASGVIIPFSYHSKKLDTKFLFSCKGRRFGHISGIGNRRHDSFKLDLWPHCSFQTDPSSSKSIEPSPGKRCEFSRDRPISQFFDYIFGTGSRRHDLFHLICGHIMALKRAQDCPNRLSNLRRKDVSLLEVGL